MCAIGILGRFLILCLLLRASVGMHKGSRGLKGGSSSSTHTRRYEIESEPQVLRSHYSESSSTFNEPQVSRSHYSEHSSTCNEPQVSRSHYSEHSSTFTDRHCQTPSSPINGQVSCKITNDKYSCTGSCRPGYTFPDGSDTLDIECSREAGEWIPYATFKDCTGGSGSQSSGHKAYNQGSYSRTLSQSSAYGGSSSNGGGGQPSSFHVDRHCQRPSSPNNGQVSCKITNDKYSCTGSCRPGFTFPDGSNSLDIECSREAGDWIPYSTFKDCMGGSYSRTLSQSSTYGGGSHDEGGERHSSFLADRLCQRPSSPNNGQVSCKIANNKYSCTGSCRPGYTFPDGSESIDLECSREAGEWIPYATFKDCIGGSGTKSSSQKAYGQGSYSRTFTQDSTYGGGSYGVGGGQHSSLLGQSVRCKMPKNPANGYHSCSMSNGQWRCQGVCNPGYEFSDGRDQVTLSCNERDGKWSPRETFSDCLGSGGGGYGHSSFDTSSRSQGSDQNAYRKGSHTRTLSQSSSYGDGSYGEGSYGKGSQHSALHGQSVGCEMPKNPANGYHSCSMSNGQWRCQGVCNPGYEFSDGTDQVTLSCNERDGKWSPRGSFGDCLGGRSQSNFRQTSEYSKTSHQDGYGASSSVEQSQSTLKSGYEKGGIGSRHSQSTKKGAYGTVGRGSGSQYSKTSHESGYEGGESGGRYSQSAYKGAYGAVGGGSGNGYDGISSVEQSQSTVKSGYEGGASGGRYSQSTYKGGYGGVSIGVQHSKNSHQRLDQGQCRQPSAPTNGFHSCSMSNGLWSCQGTCSPGYEFPDGTRQAILSCHDRDGRWSPKKDFGDCIPICSPKCMHGGKCIAHNSCLCSKEYRGSKCEYPLSNCDVHDRFASVGFNCILTKKETVCNVSCSSTGMTLQPPQPIVYTCSLDGTWYPDFKPICVSDSTRLFDAHTSQHGNHDRYEQTGTSQLSRGSYSLQTSRNRLSHGGNEGYGQLQQVSDEFGEFGGQQQTGHEFGGQQPQQIRQEFSQFGGQQQMGHEFGGQQRTGYEFVGQQRTEHKFDGQQRTGYEFGGQQRTGHEIGGQQQRTRQEFSQFGGQQQMGHGFGGQRQMGHEFGGQRQMGHEFGEQHHMI